VILGTLISLQGLIVYPYFSIKKKQISPA